MEAEYPPAGDIRKLMDENPLPQLPAATVAAATAAIEAGGHEAVDKHVEDAVRALNEALAAGDTAALAAVFFQEQAFFRDTLVLTYDTRTFISPHLAAAALLETTRLRQMSPACFTVQRPAVYLQVLPGLVFIDASLTFHTDAPGATGSGRVLLVPVLTASSNVVAWKIWILSTQLDSFDAFCMDESRLTKPLVDPVQSEGPIETDVIIIGGGNAGVALGSRLKALDVRHLIVEKNAQPGDNWAKRYDNVHFHTPTSLSSMPYIDYDKELQSPHLLTRDELASQVKRFVQTIPLNILYQTTVRSTRLDSRTGQWTVILSTAGGKTRTLVAKHLVQATGLGSQVPNKPKIKVEAPFSGADLHSATFKNASELHARGVRSVAVIGLGIYDVIGVAAGDRMSLTLPSFVDGHMSQRLFAQLASAEPNRYAKLATAGFPVIDSCDANASLMHHVLERAGGHYIDIGGTKLLADGRAAVRARVEPVAYTSTGLRLSDGSMLDVDAIVWCTGFADRDVRCVAESILGGDVTDDVADEPYILGPSAIAARLDAIWGVDAEGEIRGIWKRHSRLPTYWFMGGQTQQHRAFSRTLALQLKAALSGILPLAYRG
ncbi:flavin-containing monooxygenase [Grosmannia clavigera kw1407]|uniref:Flavin-containing monooxygenase n=1 Tax=Grosmannia clavigera (strain kw1407 / UAMH 11150) TaxID=655863 RepID=F0XKW5_GROCL|nr:flavin-containing monooxygenase [Grosmannia clavigera kw1407]EFX01714.1 flavin-containing monooxygenase [Grosmannia clavigera kw1407]